MSPSLTSCIIRFSSMVFFLSSQNKINLFYQLFTPLFTLKGPLFLIVTEDQKFLSFSFGFKGRVWHFGEYTYSLSCREFDKKINTTLMSVQ